MALRRQTISSTVTEPFQAFSVQSQAKLLPTPPQASVVHNQPLQNSFRYNSDRDRNIIAITTPTEGIIITTIIVATIKAIIEGNIIKEIIKVLTAITRIHRLTLAPKFLIKFVAPPIMEQSVVLIE